MEQGGREHRMRDWAGKGMARRAKDSRGGLRSNCQRHLFYSILHQYSVLWPHRHLSLCPTTEEIMLKQGSVLTLEMKPQGSATSL